MPRAAFSLDSILASTTNLHTGRSALREQDLDEDVNRRYQLKREREATMRSSNACSDKCEHCPSVRLVMDPDGNALVCAECGIEARGVPCDAEERRTFADDDPAAREAKKRAEVDRRDQMYALSSLLADDIPNSNLRAVANTRLRQIIVWKPKLCDDRIPGDGLWLSEDEGIAFVHAARAACRQWATERATLLASRAERAAAEAAAAVRAAAPKGQEEAAVAAVAAVAARKAAAAEEQDTLNEAALDMHFGSPVFWAIALARAVAARRFDGFVVRTAAMAECWTMSALHARLSHFKSEIVATAERLGNRTVATGGAAVGACVLDDTVRRSARFDELGDETSRCRKLQYLNGLLKRSGVWTDPDAKEGEGGDPYKIGMVHEVLLDKPPVVRPHPWEKNKCVRQTIDAEM